MKKIIKFLCLTLAVATLVLSVGCKKDGDNKNIVSMATIVYGEVLSNGGDQEWKMVLCPIESSQGTTALGMGGAVLPSENAVDSFGESVTVEKGDLIIMNFEEGIYIRQETNPKAFINEPTSIEVVSKNYTFEKVQGGYNFTIPLLDVYNGLLVQEGRKLEFYTYKTTTKPTEKPSYSAVIDGFVQPEKEWTDGYIKFFVNESSVTSVINSLAFGYVWAVK